MELPLFPTTVVGSWPRSKEILHGLRDKKAGRINESEFNKIADKAVIDCLRLQEEVDLDIVSDGEQRRDNFISFVAGKLDNRSRGFGFYSSFQHLLKLLGFSQKPFM
ncbi:MAG TPA: hypothetical protein DEO65_18800 [Bacillus bacterium]|uniref:Cobalamin-independent methionine synthase MetE C-terminal/archaeal domain-containing protein n=1 Tax=Siminovitchia fordii TaxID=254759 RepID=A0ABQ4KBJ6_9BACI|nr:hypothetical protein [Siminovitchia fordii]GIN22386.1 hypothetical protein J1TS3_35200 [Siminovitchia fordii]HBZ11886.1 hypothetical protein [Bacillus sp. (in: firmicutes)]